MFQTFASNCVKYVISCDNLSCRTLKLRDYNFKRLNSQLDKLYAAVASLTQRLYILLKYSQSRQAPESAATRNLNKV